MTDAEYAEIRRRIGSQKRVGAALDRDPTTISKRENGARPIEREAELALLYLAEHPEEV